MSIQRLLILTTHPAPYRDDTFHALADMCGCRLKLLMTMKEHNHTEWKYNAPHDFDVSYVSGGRNFGKLGILYDEYTEAVKTWKPDAALVCNYASILYTKIFHPHVKTIMMTDNIRDGSMFYKLLPVKMFIHWCYYMSDGAWCAGNAGIDFYVNQKKYLPPDKIRPGLYTNDTARICANYSRYDRQEERRRLGISADKYVLLFVGQLIPKRKIERLIEAAEYFADKDGRIHFIVVGSGEEEHFVEDYAKNHSNLTHIPSLPLAELESVYAASDAYIHLGAEPYSLALYEAAILGKPVVANREVGAVYDCINNGANGIIINYADGTDNVHAKILEAASGAYDDGAKEMSRFI